LLGQRRLAAKRWTVCNFQANLQIPKALRKHCRGFVIITN
jgi:hypothetical protein